MTDGVLVIGYGNAMRRDDGAGQRLARLVAASKLPGVRSLAVHQLSPELAEALASARVAVFVDAEEEAEAAAARPITEAPGLATLGHACGPAWLLALAQAIYGRRPPAWLVSVPAQDTGHGTGLSSSAKRGVREGVEIVRRLVSPQLNSGARASEP